MQALNFGGEFIRLYNIKKDLAWLMFYFFKKLL